jgi:hypothetical protein
MTDRGANTATFFKNPQLQSNPDALAIDNDSGDRDDDNIRMTSLQDEFIARVHHVLNGLSVAEFSQLPD